MDVPFTYIRNKIRNYHKEELLHFCYEFIDTKRDEIFPIWIIFTLMKWSYLHGSYNVNLKKLDKNGFIQLYNLIYNFNNSHVSNFIKLKIDRGLFILYSQQFYLQKSVYKETFATQLKIFSTIKGRYDIEKSFEEKTGLTIKDFLFLQQSIWLLINANKFSDKINFFGHLNKEFINLLIEVTSTEKVNNFFALTILNYEEINETISNFRRSIHNEDLQLFETTFFTMFPFQIFNNQLKVIHYSVYNHFSNYYIYDFLKSNDKNFTTEFGNRFEKYVEFGIKELNVDYEGEATLKKRLPKKSNVVDFCLLDDNIYIECKAIELQPYTSVNPTDEILYNSLKDSLLKAYFKQLLYVAETLTPDKVNWGIVLTYKELFWSSYNSLYELGEHKFLSAQDSSKHLPPENVFIMDIYTWDKIVQIVKDKKATLTEILNVAKNNNSNFETMKQLFGMHLDVYNLAKLDLNYLSNEIEMLEFKK